MVKKAASRRPALVKKRRRGGPPKPGGPKSQGEVQRAYRARLKAAGKVFRIVDAKAAGAAPTCAVTPSLNGFDPTTQVVCDREYFEGITEKLQNALLKIERQEQEVDRLSNATPISRAS